MSTDKYVFVAITAFLGTGIIVLYTAFMYSLYIKLFGGWP